MFSPISTSLSGLPIFASYFFLALALIAVFVLIYINITPYKELRLIREGNLAAAISLSGALFGFVLPLASAITYSVNVQDMLVWGVVALAVQLAVFAVIALLLPTLRKDIPQNKVAPAVLLAAVSLAAGIINAACMTY